MSEKPKVYNMKDREHPTDAIYIGRPSKWGNPYTIGVDGTRKQVIEKYEQRLLGRTHLLQRAKIELRGRNLLCFCAPKACHGDVLLRIANS